jgi:hypothetical protein
VLSLFGRRIKGMIRLRPEQVWTCNVTLFPKGGYTLVTLPRIVTPYYDSADGTRDRVTYQKVGYAVTLQACSVCWRYLAVASKG